MLQTSTLCTNHPGLRRWRRVAAAGLFTLAVTISSSACASESSPSDPGPVVGEGLSALPTETPQDIVTYGDHVALATVVSEVEQPKSDRDARVGEGLIGRKVTLRFEGVEWSRLSAKPLPESVEFQTTGWVFKGDTKREFRMADEPRLTVGHRYLVSMIFNNDQIVPAQGWIPQGGTTTYELQADRITTLPETSSVELSKFVGGKTPQAVGDLLAVTAPDPAALPFMNQGPIERYRSVDRAKNGG